MKLINTLKGHTGCINSLTGFTHFDNNYLISGSSDSTVRIWNQTSNESIYQLETEHKDSIQAIAYSDRYRYLAIGSRDKSLTLWEKSDEYEGSISKNIVIETCFVLAILPNSNIVSACADNTIKILNSTTLKIIQNLIGHASYILALAILPNSNIVSGSSDTTIKIWQSESPFKCLANLTGHTYDVQ